jgi:hypothetical protein
MFDIFFAVVAVIALCASIYVLYDTRRMGKKDDDNVVRIDDD